jgi:hypothetical protein
MSSVRSSASKQAARQYVAASVFHNDFFSYTVSKNVFTNVTTGILAAPIAGANALNCPAGRILRESGKKLYPGVHPGVSTYMVGVIDSVTFLAGYIDPNSPIFAVSNNDIPAVFANGVDPGPGGLADEGQPVFTNGRIVAAGDAVIGGNALISGNESVTGTIVANGQIRCVGPTGARVAVNGAQANIAIDARQGSFVFISGDGDNTLTVTNFSFGDRLFIQLVGTGTVRFSTGFGTAADTMTTPIAKNSMMFSFVCDGAHMLQNAQSSWFYVH